MADREPQRPADRPSGDMTDSRRTQRTDHASHDLHVLAAAADRSVDDTTRMAAEQQVAACADCAVLFADLRLLSAGLGALPKSMAVTRDFRISPERAAQLRPAGWRGALQALFGSGPSLRPFASALTTLGIAGLLLTVALPGVIGGLGIGSSAGAAAPAPEQNSLSTVGQTAGGGKSNDSAAPELNPGGAPGGAETSPTIARDITTSPFPYESTRLNEFNAAGSGAPRPASTAADSLAPTANPAAPATSFPVLGILAAASFGALLLGVLLLIRSRARPFDSVG